MDVLNLQRQLRRRFGGKLGTAVLILAAILLSLRAWQGETSLARNSDAFDYYVLALSWSPSYCRDNPGRSQCGRQLEFIMHGLWPQFESGFPLECDTPHAPPDRRILDEVSAATPDRGLIRHQWRRHGTCSGMTAEAYFNDAMTAWNKVKQPELTPLRRQDGSMSWEAVEKAFLEVNPRFSADSVTVKCKKGRLSEVRVCLTKDLQARACGREVVRDCRDRGLEVPAPR